MNGIESMPRREFLKKSALGLTGLVATRSVAAENRITPDVSGGAEISAKAAGRRLAHFWNRCVGAGRAVTLQLRDLPALASFVVETLDKDNGSVLEAWEKMGSPEPPSREQIAELKKRALATRRETLCADDRGGLKFDRTPAPWTLILLKQQ